MLFEVREKEDLTAKGTIIIRPGTIGSFPHISGGGDLTYYTMR